MNANTAYIRKANALVALPTLDFLGRALCEEDVHQTLVGVQSGGSGKAFALLLTITSAWH
jgi:hypothetical protein